VSEAVTSEAIVRRDAIRSDRRHPVVAEALAGSGALRTSEAIVALGWRAIVQHDLVAWR
jgi:hypothetical protein